MIFKATFSGVRVNACGVSQRFNTLCWGNTQNDAEINLYDRYEHIIGLTMVERPITIIKACKPGDYIYRVVDGKLIGATDPENSSWKVVAGEAYPGFVCCENQATGVTRQLNDGLECVVRDGSEW